MFEIRKRDCKQVFVAASTTGWKPILELRNELGNDLWRGVFKISNPPARLDFKFVVDGNWTTSSQYPTANDGTGNINNYVITEQR